MKKENIEITMEEETFTLHKLEDGEEWRYKLIGSGCGINFGHCFWEGVSHSDNFQKRVVAYKNISNKEGSLALTLERLTGKKYLEIKFYELA
jgi:hypothetical protein